MNSKRWAFFVFMAALALAPAARAVVTNIVWYRLGENDPGASNGVAVTNRTVDLIGFENLRQSGGPIYTNGVSTGASNNVGSSLAMQFNGTSQYLSNTVVSTLTDNFGIEAWVKPDTVVGGVNHIIVFDGDTGSSGIGSGWGLYQNGGNFFGALGVFGGLGNVGSGTAVAGTWTHLALVRSGGVATLYVNGVASGSTSSTAPSAAAGGFAIGSFPQAPTGQYFSGSIDEVRVFTFGFDPSTSEPLFSTNDLLVNLKRVTTLGPVSFSSSNATLAGAAYPPGLTTSAWFVWGTTTNYGNVTPSQFFGGQAGSTNFSQPISNLVINTTYHFAAVVSNSLGFATGGDQSFTTPGPSVQTLAATGIDTTTATLNGATPPGSSSGSAWFQWGATTNYGNLTAMQVVYDGGANFSQAISNLLANTTYQFRAMVSNSLGVANGTNVSFTTLLPLTVASLPATAVGTSSATLNGTANPGGGSTAGYFEYGTTTNYGSATTLQPLGGGTNATNFSQILTTLTAGQTYHYRADATRNGGMALALGGDQSFTMPTLPAVTTLPAGAVGLSTATLNGSANPEGSATTVWFIWGQTAHTNVTAPQAAGAGVTATNFSQAITGLTGGTVYSYQSVASNAAGVVTDPSGQSFTIHSLPTIVTLAASAVGSSGATLNGSANPLGLSASAWFEWGMTTNYGNATPVQALGSGNSVTNFSQTVPGLLGGVTYNYRADASNSFGAIAGANQSFTTPVFALATTNLPGLSDGAVAWGDCNNDGLLDILMTGLGTDSNPYTGIWSNSPVGFNNFIVFSPLNFPPVLLSYGSCAWGDYDNDGWLDFSIHGLSTLGRVSELAHNTGAGFVVTSVSSGAVFSGSTGWGDFDGDGKSDLLIAGEGSFTVVANSGGSFSNVYGSGGPANAAAAGDYDNDGRLDVLGDGGVWRNTGNGLSNLIVLLPLLQNSSVAWGDYDNDGRLDILLAGTTNTLLSGGTTQVWRNTGSGFTNINAGLPGISQGSVAWGDYDNDGRLDILLSGFDVNSNRITQVWRNTGNGFSNINAALPGVGAILTQGNCSVAWGDYDNDGRLDILLSGATNSSTNSRITQVWRNNTAVTNTPPTAPGSLTATVLGSNSVAFNWGAATDAQTPSSGLSYNLRVGFTPGGGEIVGPMADGNGFRRVPQLGNAQMNRFRTISGLPLGQTIYWSVQAIDTAFAGSPWAPEQSFKLLKWDAPTILASPSLTTLPVGDYSGNGIIDEQELEMVLSNYFPNSPWLFITNVAGLGGTNVTFTLSNSTAGAFSVEYSTNLTDWQFLGPATPLYEFFDTNAPAQPQRYYRLRWP